MSIDVYDEIRKELISNKEVLCLLAFLETSCHERPVLGANKNVRSSHPSILVTILRTIYRIDGSVKQRINNSSFSSFLNTPSDLSNINLTPKQYGDIRVFITQWIERLSNMCETDWIDESDVTEDTLYHYAHLSIQKIYAVLFGRETKKFLNRVRDTYRDSFKLNRTPSVDEETKLNDYRKWNPDDLFLAIDDGGEVHFITPFGMKISLDDGIFFRELVGGDIVKKPTMESMVQSFKDSFNPDSKMWGDNENILRLALSLEYKGVFWEDQENDVDLIRSSGSGIPGKEVNSTLLNLNINGTSGTSLSITKGRKTLDMNEKNLSFNTGERVLISNSPNFFMQGSIISYDSNNSQLFVDIDIVIGHGTYNIWDVSQISDLKDETYKYPIFIDQFYKIMSEFAKDFNDLMERIIKERQKRNYSSIQILTDEEIRNIASSIIRSTSDRSLFGEITSFSKSTVTGVVLGMIAFTSIIRVGAATYYNPSKWKNFYKGTLINPVKNVKKAAKQARKQSNKVLRKQEDLVNTWIKHTGIVQNDILSNIKNAYKLTQFIDYDWFALTVSIVTKPGIKAIVEKEIVQRFIERLTESTLIRSGVTITLGAELLLTIAVSYVANVVQDYVLQYFAELELQERRETALIEGYAPEAYAKYNIRIPMSQFGHIADISIQRQFLERTELLVEDPENPGQSKIITGDPIQFIDRRLESYNWTKRTLIPGSVSVGEGIWPVNFAPLSTIESAKSAIIQDFNLKIKDNKTDVNLKSVPPKLKTREEVGILFPEFPWGISSSTCIPSFVDAAKEAQRNNQLFGDINRIYRYNEFMNTVGKIVSTPDGLVPNISKMTSLSFTNAYVISLSGPLLKKIVRDVQEVVNIIESENNPSGEFTSNTNIIIDEVKKTITIDPYRKISQTEPLLFASKPSIRPNSNNRTKDGKNLSIGQRVSSSDYVQKSTRSYFPNIRLSGTRVINDSNPPPTDVDVIIPSAATRTLIDVRSTNPLVRILTESERNGLRLASALSTGKTNIEDYILTDVPISSSPGSSLKLDESLKEGSCALKKPERGDSPSRPDTPRDTSGRGRGPAGGGTCFPEYTKVLTPNGYIKISEMNVGDKIIAFDDNGNLVESSVTHKFIHDGEEITDVFSYTLSNGNEIHITDNHPVLVPTGDFLQIGSLKMGDSVIDENGNEIQLVSKKFIEKLVVYNLEVEKYHTYIADGIRVHNLTNKWFGGRRTRFIPGELERRGPGFILIDSSAWLEGGGGGDGDDRSQKTLVPGDSCFPAWSLIKTKNGIKQISDIFRGEEILTFNREIGKMETSVVTEVNKHEEKNHPVYRYELSDGNYIDITKNHRVLTSSGYFKYIGKLTIGDSIVTESGEYVSIINEYHLDDCHVYNLQVESNQSYIVNGIIVSDR